MPTPLLQVDAFASGPFRGNPAAVCLLDAPADAAWMQQVAGEMNLAETAFVSPRADGDLDLRWFTPLVEVDLCGHATLASAHALWETGRLATSAVARFHTRSGLLTAERAGDLVELDFPATPPVPAPPPDGLAVALGATPVATFRSRFDVVAEFADEATVRRLAPDIGALARVQARGVIVTAPGREFDCVSRFFAPAVGVPEDPVTGSAHCALAPFWAARLGRGELRAWQASPRGGELRLRVVGDRVRLGGRAVTVLRGELLA